jgi:hypothetical protein
VAGDAEVVEDQIEGLTADVLAKLDSADRRLTERRGSV